MVGGAVCEGAVKVGSGRRWSAWLPWLLVAQRRDPTSLKAERVWYKSDGAMDNWQRRSPHHTPSQCHVAPTGDPAPPPNHGDEDRQRLDGYCRLHVKAMLAW